jgi:LmbE family N-acetylglucosaminyl deacetylase
MMERVLAIGAHFDDVELAMGGTLIRHIQEKDSLSIAVMKANEELSGPSNIRLEEQRESCRLLWNAVLICFNHPWSIESIVFQLDAIKPTILYFPFESDYHQDHNFASKVGYAVSRNVQITVLRYLCTTSHSYYPNYLAVIDIEAKKKLVSVFKSQMERRPKFMEIMEAQNRFFGSLIPGNGHFAEGFCAHRIVKI